MITELVTSFLLKHVVEGKIKGKKIGAGWCNLQLGDLKERQDTGIRKRRSQIALYGELVLGEFRDLHKTGYVMTNGTTT